ncbi:hypothetical protein LINGRAHAP2_LOCUS24834 [Linum grandiflorum]
MGSSSSLKKMAARSLKCRHDCEPVLKVANTDKNRGRAFFRCRYWETNDCGYFQWESAGKSEFGSLAAERSSMGEELTSAVESGFGYAGGSSRAEAATVQIELVMQELQSLRVKLEMVDSRVTLLLGSMWVVVLIFAIGCIVR